MAEIRNLLEETLEALEDLAGASVHDVIAVQNMASKRMASWKDFAKISSDITYDAGFGIAEISVSLIVLLKDGSWLERQEYDGAEWWRHMVPPKEISGDGAPLSRQDILA